MSVYMTEAEQLEAMKKWWARYGSRVIMAISVVLLLASGYKYWGWHQDKINQQASMSYEQLMAAFSNDDREAVRSHADALLRDYSRTVYADVAHLTLAKLFVADADFAHAQTELEHVASHSRLGALQQIAKIRLARLLVAQQQFDEALASLDRVDGTAYMPLVSEIKGDIFVAKGQHEEAIAAYKQALSSAQVQGIANAFLEMKTRELVAMSQSMATPVSQLV